MCLIVAFEKSVLTSLTALQLGQDTTAKRIEKLTKAVNKLAKNRGQVDASVEMAAPAIKPDRQILADDFQLPLASVECIADLEAKLLSQENFVKLV